MAILINTFAPILSFSLPLSPLSFFFRPSPFRLSQTVGSSIVAWIMDALVRFSYSSMSFLCYPRSIICRCSGVLFSRSTY